MQSALGQIALSMPWYRCPGCPCKGELWCISELAKCGRNKGYAPCSALAINKGSVVSRTERPVAEEALQGSYSCVGYQTSACFMRGDTFKEHKATPQGHAGFDCYTLCLYGSVVLLEWTHNQSRAERTDPVSGLHM